MAPVLLNTLDKVEILTLQDNRRAQETGPPVYYSCPLHGTQSDHAHGKGNARTVHPEHVRNKTDLRLIV